MKLGFASPIYSGPAITFGGAAGVFLDHAHALTLGPELTGETAFTQSSPFSPNGTVAHLLFGAHYFPTDRPLEVGVAAGARPLPWSWQRVLPSDAPGRHGARACAFARARSGPRRHRRHRRCVPVHQGCPLGQSRDERLPSPSRYRQRRHRRQ